MDAGSGATIDARRIAITAGPPIAIALAGLATRTPLAAAYPATAALLFLWIAADTSMLSLTAGTRPGRPAVSAVIATLAAASVTVWIASPPPLRAALWSMPWIVGGMALAILLHVAFAAKAARHILRTSLAAPRDRWTALAGTLIPPAIVRLAAAEFAVLHMALFRWGGPGDVPSGARAFAYHRHLTPMSIALLILSGIEVAVYHLLLAHWSGTAAMILFVVSDVGLVYLVGLIKSFRFRPVLVTQHGLQVRAGFLIDQTIPFTAITRIDSAFEAAQIRNASTLNAALLAWPNILVTLDSPCLRHPLRPGRRYAAIAFRLDEPVPFLSLMCWRLGHAAAY